MKNLKHKMLLVAGLVAGTVLVLGLQLSGLPQRIERTSVGNPDDLKRLPVEVSISSRLLFGGDVFWGRSVERTARASESGYAYPFSGLDTLDRDFYQAWIANLECPVTTQTVSFTDQANLLKFNCPPEFLPGFAGYFDVVSLANNHTDNVGGQSGLLETRQHLETEGLQYFGHFDNNQSDDLCEVVAVNALLNYDSGFSEPTRLPLALCGLHGVFEIPTAAQMEAIRVYAQYLPTIVMPHMGAEYQPASDNIRQNVYRYLINNIGVDVVIGNHPHWVQNTEVIDGKLIVYSMGNLIFDQQFSTEVRRSMMVDMTLNLPFDEQTLALMAMADDCLEFKDDCLNELMARDWKKIVPDIEYGLVATWLDENMVVHKASASVQSAIEQRANWQRTMAQLGNE